MLSVSRLCVSWAPSGHAEAFGEVARRWLVSVYLFASFPYHGLSVFCAYGGSISFLWTGHHMEVYVCKGVRISQLFWILHPPNPPSLFGRVRWLMEQLSQFRTLEWHGGVWLGGTNSGLWLTFIYVRGSFILLVWDIRILCFSLPLALRLYVFSPSEVSGLGYERCALLIFGSRVLVGSTCGGPGMRIFAGGGVRYSWWSTMVDRGYYRGPRVDAMVPPWWMRYENMWFLLLFFLIFFKHCGYLGCSCLNFHRASVLFFFFD